MQVLVRRSLKLRGGMGYQMVISRQRGQRYPITVLCNQPLSVMINMNWRFGVAKRIQAKLFAGEIKILAIPLSFNL